MLKMCEIKNIISNRAVLKNQEYSDRLEKELYYINELNQVDNILQAYEVKQIIESFNVPFFIRGSAGGSLVLFLLGFTSVDPVKNNILFERFIN